MAIFDTYDKTKDYKVRRTLLWDVNYDTFDFQKGRRLVVSRILERGYLEDFFAAFNLYGGVEGFKEVIKELPHLTPRDIAFATKVFGIKKKDLICYERKRLREAHLNS